MEWLGVVDPQVYLKINIRRLVQNTVQYITWYIFWK